MLYLHQGCALPEYEYIRRILKIIPPHRIEIIEPLPPFSSLSIIYIADAFVHVKSGHFTWLFQNKFHSSLYSDWSHERQHIQCQDAGLATPLPSWSLVSSQETLCLLPGKLTHSNHVPVFTTVSSTWEKRFISGVSTTVLPWLRRNISAKRCGQRRLLSIWQPESRESERRETGQTTS